MIYKWLERIPLYNLIRGSRSHKSRQTSLEKLYLIKDSFKQAVSYDDIYDSLKGILLNDLRTLQLELIKDKTTKVSFHTKTSNSALELIDDNVYGYESLNASTTKYSSELIPRPFMYWESNDESILLFYSFMKEMIIKATLLYGTVDNSTLENNQISEEEKIFIDSILFRELCFDFISLLVFYLEESNEDTE